MELSAKSLYNKTLAKNNIILTPIQEYKFLHACEKCIIENPTLNINELILAAQIYLNLILNFPELDLGGFQPPTE